MSQVREIKDKPKEGQVIRHRDSDGKVYQWVFRKDKWQGVGYVRNTKHENSKV